MATRTSCQSPAGRAGPPGGRPSECRAPARGHLAGRTWPGAGPELPTPSGASCPRPSSRPQRPWGRGRRQGSPGPSVSRTPSWAARTGPRPGPQSRPARALCPPGHPDSRATRPAIFSLAVREFCQQSCWHLGATGRRAVGGAEQRVRRRGEGEGPGWGVVQRGVGPGHGRHLCGCYRRGTGVSGGSSPRSRGDGRRARNRPGPTAHTRATALCHNFLLRCALDSVAS